MRKSDVTQHAMFSYRTLGERIPDEQPLRKLRARLRRFRDDGVRRRDF
jgi:hypothetical protein